MIKNKYSKKTEVQNISKTVNENENKLNETSETVEAINQLLVNLKVDEFKDRIDTFEKEILEEFNGLKKKFKLKADYSDVLKLEEMILNL